jgi:hypothetical protein
MSIITLQRKIAESGRIRIGQQVDTGRGKRPEKLTTFRLTSPDRSRIEQAAQLFGGTVQPWQAPAGNQWEVVTETDALNVIVPPSDMAFSQWFELWSAGGCARRCDGHTETITDAPCVCDPDNRECSIHTRLSVFLADMRGLGFWRVDTSGYYAAVELQGAVEVLKMAAARGQMLPARLCLEQRMVKRVGQGTRRFAVPVLDIDVSPAQLLGGQAGAQHDGGTRLDVVLEQPAPTAVQQSARPALIPVPNSVPEFPVPSVAEQATAELEPRRRRSNAAPPVPASGLAPRTAAEVAATQPDSENETIPLPPEQPDSPNTDTAPADDLITPAQLKKLAILLRENGFEERDAKLGFVIAAIERDITSSKELTKTEAHKVIDLLENDK